MNKYGTVLEEMDLTAVISDFQRQVLLPLSRLLFPGELVSTELSLFDFPETSTSGSEPSSKD